MTSPPPATTCYRHPDRATGLACTRCGRPACPECLQPADVGQHCAQCRGSSRATNRPLRVASHTTTQPLATFVLIAANVLVYLVTALQARSLLNNDQSRLFDSWVLAPRAVADGQWVRVLGSGFLHFGPVHLVVNMLALYFLGRDAELALGRARFVAVYLLSLLGGSAAVMWLSSNSATAGASGAIYGLFGLLTALVLRLRRNPTQLLVLIAINLFISVRIPGISLWGHLGGLAAGTLGGIALLFLPSLLGAHSQRTFQLIGWVAVAFLTLVTLVTIVTAALHLQG